MPRTTLALDGSALGGPPGGIQESIWNLLEALLRLRPELEPVLTYVGQREGLERLRASGLRARIRPLVLPRRLARLNDVVGYLLSGALAGPCEAYWAPTFHLPAVGLYRRSVISVFDLSPIRHPEFIPRRPTMWIRKLRRSCRLATGIVVNVEAMRRELHELLGVPLEKIHVIPLGAHGRYRRPLDPEPVLARLGLSGAPYLLSVGTVQPRKNYVRLIEAFETLAPRVPDARLVIVGHLGWMYEPVLEALRRSPDRIRLLDHVPDEEMPALYRGARGVVLPSVYEGFGLPIVEAMESGAPLAVSAGGAMEEVAGGAARLFDPWRPEAIAAAMEDLLVDEGLRRRLVEAGARRARDFDWDRSALLLARLLVG